MRFGVPTLPAAAAKAKLPEVLDAARRHLLQIISRHGRDPVAVLALEDLRELLREHRFATEVAMYEGEATVTLPQFSIIGIGASLESATTDALEKLREYAVQYLQRYEFYRHTDRRNLYPLIVRLLSTPEDEQVGLLLESDASEVAPDTG